MEKMILWTLKLPFGLMKDITCKYLFPSKMWYKSDNDLFSLDAFELCSSIHGYTIIACLLYFWYFPTYSLNLVARVQRWRIYFLFPNFYYVSSWSSQGQMQDKGRRKPRFSCIIIVVLLTLWNSNILKWEGSC